MKFPHTLLMACTVALFMIGCGPGETVEAPEDEVAAARDTVPPVEEVAEQITVEEFEYTLQNGRDRVVSGVIYNPTPRNVRHAEVRIGLYDDNNILVETIAVPVQGVEAGERKRFRHTIHTAVEYPSARVRDIMVLR